MLERVQKQEKEQSEVVVTASLVEVVLLEAVLTERDYQLGRRLRQKWQQELGTELWQE